MLGKMELGADYDEVLKEAQDLGFAEADPTADVEGHDVRAKIAILAKLAFGTTISPVESIPCRGISAVTAVDFEYAKLLGCTIKLVGTAARLSQYGMYSTKLGIPNGRHCSYHTHTFPLVSQENTMVHCLCMWPPKWCHSHTCWHQLVGVEMQWPFHLPI